ncbi:MAG: methyltransferase [Clostridiales bacterium]|nr:methyltransferase [Clostridiales bacterium]
MFSTNETIEDLQFKGLKIILSADLPRFTTDSVLLSDFCKAKSNDFVADLGSGTGIISLLVHGRYGCSVVGFEINSELSELMQRSIILNGLEDKILVENMDFCEAYKQFNGAFDVCVCNPPYFNSKSHIVSQNVHRSQARTQGDVTILDIARAATRILKSSGTLYMSYPVDRLVDAFYALRSNKLEPKSVQFVRANQSSSPYLALIKAKKDGGVGMNVLDDFVIYDESGIPTEMLNKAYHK